MAGSVLSAGALALAGALSLGLVAVGGAAVAAQRAAGAADAAALAAADAASGAVVSSDDPCALAARVAAANGASVTSCTASGDEAVVEVSVPFAGFAAASRARAGPSGDDPA